MLKLLALRMFVELVIDHKLVLYHPFVRSRISPRPVRYSNVRPFYWHGSSPSKATTQKATMEQKLPSEHVCNCHKKHFHLCLRAREEWGSTIVCT